MIDMSMNVLVVNDFIPTRQQLGRTLRRLGFSNVKEVSGPKALGLIKRSKFGLVIINWVILPDISDDTGGIELVKTIRSDENLKDIPVLMTVSGNRPDIFLDVLGAGADNYLIIPFVDENVKTAIDKIFEE